MTGPLRLRATVAPMTAAGCRTMSVRLRRWPAEGRPAAGSAVDRPCGQLVGTFSDYREAERAVDVLVARGFGDRELSVTGNGLRLVEDRTALRAMRFRAELIAGAMGGGLFGVMLALVLGFVGITDPIVPAGAVMSWGAAVGALAGLGLSVVTRKPVRLVGGRSARPPLEAASYSLFCHTGRAAAAQRALRDMP